MNKSNNHPASLYMQMTGKIEKKSEYFNIMCKIYRCAAQK